ncbi:MAG: hypothetical protein IJ512_08425 [Ruminococcus sp.]|nr:hypothetical protein [Ruminococcus sp.]
MKKQLCGVLSAAVMTSAASTLVQAEYKTIQMTVAPENMLNVRVKDKAGNLMEGVTAVMTDSSGTVAAEWSTGETKNRELDSDIKLYGNAGTNYHFKEPCETFTSLAAPYTIEALDDYTDGVDQGGEFETHVFFNSGQTRTLTLLAYDPDLAADEALSSNMLGMYVDSRWANRQATSFFQLDGTTFYLNKTTSALAGSPIGKLSKYFYNMTMQPDGTITSDPNFTGFTEMYFGVEHSSLSNIDNFAKEFTFDYDAREYIKYRTHITDLYWQCNHSFDTWDNTTGTFTVNENVYSLAADPADIEGQDCTTTTLMITSGTMISAPIPDENGYIEFYVDKASRRYSAYLTGAWRKCDSPTSWGGGIMEDYALNEFAGENYSLEVTAVTLPETGDTLMYVPAGSYTLSFTGGTLGNNIQSVPVTVAQSQEVQYISVTLEDAAVKGDVNNDGSVDLDDAVLTLTHYAHIGAGLSSDLSEAQLMSADVNVDGTADLTDASMILCYYAETSAGLSPQW